MKTTNLIIGGVLGLSALIGFEASTYTVKQTEQAVVTEFGKPVKVVIGSREVNNPDQSAMKSIKEYCESKGYHVAIDTKPGLKFKKPFVQKVTTFPNYMLEYESKPNDLTTNDKKYITIDHYTRWRIENPLLYMQTVRNENGAYARLDDRIYSAVLNVVGQNNLIELVRSTNREMDTTNKESVETIELGREAIITMIRDIAKEDVKPFGIEILDVQIKRADLPDKNKQAVYGRMKSERDRISGKYVSEGTEEYQKIKAETDKQVTILTSEAELAAQKIRGEADAQAISILAKAYSKDPEFFAFTKTLEQNKASAAGLEIITTTNSDFYKYLEGMNKK